MRTFLHLPLATCYPTTMLTLWFLLIFLGAQHKFSQYFSHVVDPLIPVTEATTDLVAYCPLAHLCTNSGPLGNIYKSHKYARLFSPPRGTLTTLVLLMCSDVEPNPGPANNAGNIFPCGYCGLNVGWSMEGVCCDNCSVWFHCSCADIGKSEYSRLNLSSQNWDCFRCCSCNSSTIPYSYNVEVSNNFSALEGLSEDCVFSPPTNYLTHTTRHSSPTTPTHTFPSMGSSVSSIHTDYTISLFICSFYRSNKDDDPKSLDDLSKALDHVSELSVNNTQTTVCVAGDFNAGDIDWETNCVTQGSQHTTLCNQLLTVVSENGLDQVHREATREDRILDLFCTNKPGLVKSSHSIPGISDHHAVLTDICVKAQVNKKPPRKITLWSKAHWDEIHKGAAEFKDSFIQNFSDNVESNYLKFRDFIESIIGKCVPTKLLSSHRNQPWFNASLRRMCKKKRRLFSVAKRSNKRVHWDRYRAHKKDTLKALRGARWTYIDSMLQTGLDEGNSKPFWRYIRSLRQDNIGVSPLKNGGKLEPDGLQKAEILSHQFKSVFTNEDRISVDRLFGPNFPQIDSLVVAQKGMEKLLSGLDVNKAAGPDAIPCRLLKGLSNELAPVLCAIFMQSLNTGELPSDWLKAYITPVFKKGARCAPENYRPVSLTCVPCKILEHIICKHIRLHLEKHGILTPLNHGFRSKFSCETQLLVTLQDLLSAQDVNCQIDLAVLDFSKAFDTVPHERLLGKLDFYGVQGPILNWIAAFLKNRVQSVVVDGARSKPVDVMSGVPQGTVLGPLLFLLHINDLPSVVTSQVRLFADDCLMYRPIRSIADQVALQCDLSALERWGSAWGMRFNASKCQVMHICKPHNTKPYMYSLCDTILETVSEAKYLGVTLTHELSWSTHVNLVATKANRTLGFLRRNLRKCPVALKETAYISMVHSVLEYASPIWDPHLRKDCDQLERVQRRAARFTCGDYRSRASVTQMLAKLGWRDLEDRRRDLRLALLFKVIKGHVAVMAETLDLTKADSRTRANHPHKLRIPRARTKALKNFITHRSISDWNALPAHVVVATTTDSFKAHLAGLAFGAFTTAAP